jgi:hypothetical protein
LHRLPNTASLLLILATDSLDLTFDLQESGERLIRDIVLDAVLLKPQPAPRKKHICLARRGKVRDAVADEDDQRNLVR